MNHKSNKICVGSWMVSLILTKNVAASFPSDKKDYHQWVYGHKWERDTSWVWRQSSLRHKRVCWRCCAFLKWQIGGDWESGFPSCCRRLLRSKWWKYPPSCPPAWFCQTSLCSPSRSESNNKSISTFSRVANPFDWQSLMTGTISPLGVATATEIST